MERERGGTRGREVQGERNGEDRKYTLAEARFLEILTNLQKQWERHTWRGQGFIRHEGILNLEQMKDAFLLGRG